MLALLWWLSLLPWAAHGAAQLSAAEREVALWPAWTALPDPGHALTLDQALARREAF